MSRPGDNAGRGRKSPAARRAQLQYLLDAADVLLYAENNPSSVVSRWAETIAELANRRLQELGRGAIDPDVDRWVEAVRREFDRHGVGNEGDA
ncbi:MAG: hypothetical protein ACRCT8_02585 [Lacipirellulaceae bacterium]